ncbi:MAG: Rieske 2Fe-2S domain-containing protein [Myxococcota bacterium]
MARRDDHHVLRPVPNGWWGVEFSKDLIVGQVKPLHVFGEDMVLFRTRDGRARVLDAYCPHLGAHLGEGGRVMGDTIRCPFHAWQFHGETGRCVSIPYCDRVPEKAEVRAWDVSERNGMIFLWYHAEQKPPDWEIPVIPEIGAPDWSEPRTFELEVPAHVQDLHENNNDLVHFTYVHRSVSPAEDCEITYSADGRTYRIVTEHDSETPIGTFRTRLIRDSFGIGQTVVRTEGIPDAGLLMFSSTVPIEPDRALMRWLLTATNNMVDIAGEEFMTALTQGVMQDMRIWTHKVHRMNPVFCEADKDLVEFRKWTRQFYSDLQPE